MDRTARKLAGSAANSSRGPTRLTRCRALLARLDPERPPPYVHAKEFRWQYRALRERVHLYSERLAAARSALEPATAVAIDERTLHVTVGAPERVSAFVIVKTTWL